jgi:hypothetical protein
MNFNFLNTEELLFRSRAERERILFDLVKTGRLDRRVCHMLLAELDMREEARKEEEEEIAAMMKRTPRLKVVRTEKSCVCPACHGIGKRNVCVSTTFRMGNYRRADGSYHLEKDGTECEQKYEWKTCPDCHGTGKEL